MTTAVLLRLFNSAQRDKSHSWWFSYWSRFVSLNVLPWGKWAHDWGFVDLCNAHILKVIFLWEGKMLVLWEIGQRRYCSYAEATNVNNTWWDMQESRPGGWLLSIENTEAFKQLSSVFGRTDGKHKSLTFINEPETSSFHLVLGFFKIKA